MLSVGLDVGFGRTKVCAKLGEKEILFSFPSWIGYGSNSYFSDIKRYGGEYWVGQEAIYSNSVIELTTVDEIIKFYPLFKEKALDIIKSKFSPSVREKDIKVVTGLPPKYYDRKNELPDVSLWQGFGGLIYLDKKLTFEPDDKVLLVDIGYNTVDYLYAARDTESWQKISADTLDNIGVTMLVNIFLEFEPSLKNVQKTTLQDVLRKGSFKIKGTEKDFSESLDKAKRRYSYILLSKLSSLLNLDQATHIVFSGGGAYYIEDSLPEDREYLIPEKPEYLNARGYCIFAEEIANKV